MKSSHLFISSVSSISADKAIQALEQGTLMLTSSPQLASQWKCRFALASGDSVVATPAVENWQQWMARMGREHGEIPAPFNSVQEQQLWERIIADDLGETKSTHGLARHAANVYRLLQEFRIDIHELIGGGEEAEALYRWIASMQRQLKEQERVLVADVPALLLSQICAISGVNQILLDGFDNITPMQKAFLQSLHEHGVSLWPVDNDGEEAAVTLVACADAEDEYRYLVRRITTTIKANAQAHIAVVTSRQVSDIDTLRRILDKALLPSTESVLSMQAVSMAGASLASIPLISQLLHLLGLAGKSGAAFADLSPLFFSPGVKGYAEERMARAAFDAALRRHNRHYLGFHALLAEAVTEGMPQLADVLDSLITWKIGARKAGEWVKAVNSLLQEIGFLQIGVAGRSISEIRQLNAFRECLASLVAVDAVHERIEWGSFLSLLSSISKETMISLPVRFPRICVLPLEQIAGLHFDCVFAVGFDEDALPFPAQPIPLLPLSLQRKHSLPGSSAALAFSESEVLWRQLKQAAPKMYASFARSREDRKLKPSPLLADIVASECDVETESPAPSSIELFDDAPRVPLSAKEVVAGGATIIRNQSLCPFRAFASHRLELAPLEETVPGITAADKGSLIHRALQYIWEHLGSQSGLLALNETATIALVDAAVAHAWKEARITAADATQGFERRRMAIVLAAWLDQERQRPAFSVMCCEKAYQLALPRKGDIRFTVHLKADRIDKDAEGHTILIDYKTGRKFGIGMWIGSRPSEPQLPLYAVAENLGIEDAVCFARVRSGDMGFEGLSGETTGIQGIVVYKGRDEEAKDWPTLMSRWRERIDALAEEFVAGRCEVMPQDVHACDYCGLEAVCRIDEIGIDRDTDEGDEA